VSIDDQGRGWIVAEKLLSRREFLVWQQVMRGVGWVMAKEAVSTTLLEHPEIDADELRTWSAWEEFYR